MTNLTSFVLVSLLLLVSCCNAQQTTSSICTNTAITVTALDVTCDSPGTYYYGSGGYRKSETCKAGDKVHAAVYFDINDGYDDLEDVYVTLLCTSVAERVDLYQADELCNLETLYSVNGTACPTTGAFKIETTFYFSSTDDDYTDDGTDTSFTPTLVVGFASDNNGGEYDLGGANTNNCAGDSLFTTLDSVTTGNAALDSFFASYGILTMTLIIIGAFVFIMYRQRVGGDDDPEDILVEDANKAELLGKSGGSIYSLS